MPPDQLHYRVQHGAGTRTVVLTGDNSPLKEPPRAGTKEQNSNWGPFSKTTAVSKTLWAAVCVLLLRLGEKREDLRCPAASQSERRGLSDGEGF